MNAEHQRTRRVAADPGRARATVRHGAALRYRAGGAIPRIGADESAALTLLSQILTGDETWSVGEVRRLLELRERGRTGLAG